MIVDLPAQSGMHCPHCNLGFSIASADLHGRETLHCPFCGQCFDVYTGLEPQLRSKVYHALRNSVEQRVYEQQQMDSGDYFEDEANLGPRRKGNPGSGK